MKDRVPRYPGRVKLTRADGSSELVTLERADDPQVVGDALNKANLLPDSVASHLGLTQSNPQIKDAFMALAPMAKLATLYSGATRISEFNYTAQHSAHSIVTQKLVDCTAYDYLEVALNGTLTTYTLYSSEVTGTIGIGGASEKNAVQSFSVPTSSTSVSIRGTLQFVKRKTTAGGTIFQCLSPVYAGGTPLSVTDPTMVYLSGGMSSGRSCRASGSITVTVKGAKKAGLFA